MFALRRHWIVPVTITLIFLAVVAIVAVLYFVVLPVYPGLFGSELAQALFAIGASTLALGIWLLYFNSLIDYYLDVWVVTNERIIIMEQKGLFSRTIAELKLYRIQDVKAEIHGVLSTILDYGEITVQTAGEEAHFEFKQIPKPYEVSREILELVEQDREKHLDEFKSEQTGV